MNHITPTNPKPPPASPPEKRNRVPFADPTTSGLGKVSKSSITPAQHQHVQEILSGFGIPLDEQEEYLAILLGHLDMALDAYFSRFSDL